MTAITMSDARKAYRAGNNAGRGYAPDGETVDEAVTAAVADGYELVLAHKTSDDVAVLQSDGETIAIGGDSMGRNAWAVRIS